MAELGDTGKIEEESDPGEGGSLLRDGARWGTHRQQPPFRWDAAHTTLTDAAAGKLAGGSFSSSNFPPAEKKAWNASSWL
eukprot:CAMPEP_0177612560 /NCGR_PEP_ID=MMETSP0419_2-20121207/21309_1 /TAXON_ID=582737 /ORGANISM="Tetraselmis sp., Strain GSL018" /LENGTH=79 /DNA_ID=CAMNT_0019108803 /DNA_START=18 /DNA_END=258 /DNA_ORIENTATION=+